MLNDIKYKEIKLDRKILQYFRIKEKLFNYQKYIINEENKNMKIKKPYPASKNAMQRKNSWSNNSGRDIIIYTIYYIYYIYQGKHPNYLEKRDMCRRIWKSDRKKKLVNIGFHIYMELYTHIVFRKIKIN